MPRRVRIACCRAAYRMMSSGLDQVCAALPLDFFGPPLLRQPLTARRAPALVRPQDAADRAGGSMYGIGSRGLQFAGNGPRKGERG